MLTKSIALTLAILSVLVASPNLASAGERNYGFSGVDFITRRDEHLRAPSVESKPLSPERHTPFAILVIEKNSRGDEDSPHVDQLVDRLRLTGSFDRITKLKDAVRELIASGKIDDYPDLRTEYGFHTFAVDAGYDFVVFHGSSFDHGTNTFELVLEDVRTGDRVFRATNNINWAVGFSRWDGVSDNEFINPCFNSLVDWLKSSPPQEHP